jgi:hypothetical protein
MGDNMLYFCSYLLIFFSALFFLFKVFEQKKGSNQSEKNVFIQKSSIGNNSITINGNDIEKKINGKVNSIIQNGNKIIVNGINITDLITKDGTVLNVTIQLDGNVDTITTDNGNILINGNVSNNVSNMNGNIQCENINGSVTNKNGDIQAGDIIGDVSNKNGDIKYYKK